MKTLIVEGWRSSCHSFALVNQHQLLSLLDDSRFRIFHRDVPLFQPHWAAIDSGLPAASKQRLAAIPAPPPGIVADVIYRVSYPFRAHGGEGRVFVFATGEVTNSLVEGVVGAEGEPLSPSASPAEIVACSHWSRRVLIEGGFAPARTHVVPLGFDPLLAEPLPEAGRLGARRALQIADDSFVFLNVGALTWNKGIGLLLAAFAAVRRAHPKAVLVLKGADALYGNWMKAALDEAAAIRPEVRDADVVRSIRYVARPLTQQDMRQLYGAADAYVSPYRAEGFNLPVLEAMAAGLAVVVTAGGATDDFCPADRAVKVRAELCSTERATWLEPDIGHLIAQLAQLIGDADSRRRIGSAGREWVRTRFAWPTVAGRLADLLAA